MQNERELSVLIIDENSGISPVLAPRLSAIPGIRVIGETANVMLGAELAHQFEPDVVLADFRRTGPPRAETYRWLARISPASTLIAHTSYLPYGDERALREAGVTRCVLKSETVKDLGAQIIATATARRVGHAKGATPGKET
jgi:DNA-binding NarL/FixJ family response regulator